MLIFIGLLSLLISLYAFTNTRMKDLLGCYTRDNSITRDGIFAVKNN
jgi:hypothetical protein